MNKHLNVGLLSSLTVTSFLDAHPFVWKVISAAILAAVSALVSQVVQRLFPKR